MVKSKEIYEMFGVGWQKGSYISGSSTFAIDKEDNIYLVEDVCGEIDWEETEKYDGMVTIFKDIWENLIPIEDAHYESKIGALYEESYRFVENNQEEIIDVVRNGGEQDWGRFYIKVFSPRQLNLKE